MEFSKNNSVSPLLQENGRNTRLLCLIDLIQVQNRLSCKNDYIKNSEYSAGARVQMGTKRAPLCKNPHICREVLPVTFSFEGLWPVF
jgi:hypothetical protein